MTPIGEILAREIAAGGPITFHRFMSAALYHPEHGYYRKPRDPFGRDGDFFTAEQVQPVFGILIAQCIRRLREELPRGENFTLVELGPGRGEMAPALNEFGYIGVDLDRGALPESFSGVVFANEFFDALPVHVAKRTGGGFVERHVDFSEGKFHWIDGPPASGAMAEYLERFAPETEICEVNLDALEWMRKIANRLQRGFVLAIDYGYTQREAIRFPQGTLMSYRRHAALDDVLADPGERDITAHAAFTPLMQCGFEVVRFETMAQMLLRAGEQDQFAAAMAASPQQLKTLLFGMGETFRALLLRAVK
jgi:SAM-dependent MidA family methyltransferase